MMKSAFADHEALLIIDTPNGHVTVSEAEFASLPQHELVTQTPWTTEKHTYRGVYMLDLLKKYDLLSYAKLTAIALNNYTTELTVGSMINGQALIAREDNGVKMKPRNKGPLWIVFPLSEHPELDNPDTHRMMVWQLFRIKATP